MTNEHVFPKKVNHSLDRLMRLLDELKSMQPADAIPYLLEKSGYLDYLRHYSSTDADYLTRVENIDELIYSASKVGTLMEYLEEAALIKDDRGDDENSPGVAFSTVHASKGLEYDTVFIVGCEEDLFPHWKSKATDEELQEERRLMYVAVTRAERNLYLSYAMSRRGQVTCMSRFLEEIDTSIHT